MVTSTRADLALISHMHLLASQPGVAVACPGHGLGTRARVEAGRPADKAEVYLCVYGHLGVHSESQRARPEPSAVARPMEWSAREAWNRRFPHRGSRFPRCGERYARPRDITQWESKVAVPPMCYERRRREQRRRGTGRSAS